MARSSRRPTFWTGAYFDGTTTPEDTLASSVVTAAADLTDDMDKEPTLVRVFGRLCVGALPEDTLTDTTYNLWLGLTLGSATDAGLPDPRTFTDDRFLWMGFIRTVWGPHYIPTFDSAGAIVTSQGLNRAYQGPWEMVDFQSRAMRKARSNDALLLQMYGITTAGNPVSPGIHGFIRALWKAR